MSISFRMELFEKLEKVKEVLPTQENFKKYLREFKRIEYSDSNKMLVFIQLPIATETYGFHTRKNMGRMVKKGARAIYIAAMAIQEKENKKTGKIEEKTYFSMKPVFDISQTDVLVPIIK